MNSKELLKLQNDVIKKVDSLIAIHGDRLPEIGNSDLTYRYTPHKKEFWTASFWPGQLWLAYKLTGEEKYKNAARMSDHFFDKWLDEPKYHDHDIGFMYSLTAVADYKLTGSEKARARGIRAAEALSGRFKYVGGYIVAWKPYAQSHEAATFANDRIIADTLQNLSLLLWAHRETGRQGFKDIALAHARTAQKYLIRDDYSSFHTFLFDGVSEKPIRGETHQGYAHDSCWSRGQSWLIHGYATLAYEYGLTEFTEVSEKLAAYYIEHLKQELDYIPVWDFQHGSEYPAYLDSSAAAVVSSGLYVLAELCPERSEYYKDWAMKMLDGLTKRCSLVDNKEAHGLLSDGASHVGKGVDYSKNMLPYGDYYYFEAILKARGFAGLFW